MATRSLTISVEPSTLSKLVDGGFKLCFAFGVNGNFNVVAKTSVITPINTIEWTENYTICATVQSFKAGTLLIKGQSEERKVTFGQKYKLPDWKTSSVGRDPSVPAASLGFYNGVLAAPVISMSTGDGELTPIFVDNVLPAKVNTTYTPVSKVRVWFDRNVKTSTMIVEGMTANPHTVNLTGRLAGQTTYTDSGEWVDQ